MTKRTFNAVAVVGYTVALYLVGAFVAYDFDIGNWATEGRLMIAALWLMLTAILVNEAS